VDLTAPDDALSWLAEIEVLVLSLDDWCEVLPAAKRRVAASSMRGALVADGLWLSPEARVTDEPMVLLRFAAAEHPQAVAGLDELLRNAELAAASSAKVRPAALDLLRTCANRGVRTAVASAASLESVRRTLDANGLAEPVHAIHGRDVRRPVTTELTPDDVAVLLDALDPPKSPAVLVTSSPAGIESARAVGIFAIGIAREPRVRVALEQANPIAVLLQLAPVVRAVAARKLVRPSLLGHDWRSLLGPAFEIVGALALVAALVVASGRLGFAKEMGVSVWAFGFDVESILLSSVIAVVGVAWLGSLAVFMLAAAVSGRRAPAYMISASVVALLAWTISHATREVDALQGDVTTMALQTSHVAMLTVSVAMIAAMGHEMIEGVRSTRTAMRRLVIVVIMLILAWLLYVSQARPPWWHAVVIAAMACAGLGMTLHRRWLDFSAYDEGSPVRRVSPSQVMAGLLFIGVIGVTAVPPHVMSDDPQPGLTQAFLIGSLILLAAWFAATFQGPRGWLARVLPPPLPAVALAAVLAIVIPCMAAFHHGAWVAAEARAASPTEPIASWYLGFDSYWTCPTPVPGMATLRVPGPALLLTAHADAFVLFTENAGAQHVPTGAVMLSPVPASGTCP
jgi:phosphoglycolate phosphatase-like HAD superfamily hydrolase